MSLDRNAPAQPRLMRLLTAVVVLALVLAAAWLFLTRAGELSFVPSGRAAALLDRIERAAALPVRERGPLVRDGPDGPMPEMAGRRLVVAAPAPAIRAAVSRACGSLGLDPAGTDRRAIEPAALCEGRQAHEGESVHLAMSCKGPCVAYVETQIVGMR